MMYTPKPREFFEQNIKILRKMAGFCLKNHYDDEMISELLSKTYLAIVRLKLLERYTPEACQRFGIALSTVITRQMLNVLCNETQARHRLKRSPEAAAIDPTGTSAMRGYDSHQIERLAVGEFLRGLEDQRHADYLLRRMQGYTGAESAAVAGMSRPTGEAWNRKLRQAWVEYDQLDKL